MFRSRRQPGESKRLEKFVCRILNQCSLCLCQWTQIAFPLNGCWQDVWVWSPKPFLCFSLKGVWKQQPEIHKTLMSNPSAAFVCPNRVVMIENASRERGGDSGNPVEVNAGTLGVFLRLWRDPSCSADASFSLSDLQRWTVSNQSSSPQPLAIKYLSSPLVGNVWTQINRSSLWLFPRGVCLSKMIWFSKPWNLNI